MSDTFVAGVLSNEQAVEEAYKRLRAIGIQRSAMSIILPTHGEAAHQAEKNWGAALKNGATSGILLGGVVGGLLGFGVLAIPGIEIFEESLLSVLVGAGTGGVLGGIAGWLSGLATSKRPSTQSNLEKQVAGILFAVYHCDESLKRRVEKIFRDCGALAILPR
jgi:hypothetical protein